MIGIYCYCCQCDLIALFLMKQTAQSCLPSVEAGSNSRWIFSAVFFPHLLFRTSSSFTASRSWTAGQVEGCNQILFRGTCTWVCNYLLLLHHTSEENIVLSTMLHLSDSFSSELLFRLQFEMSLQTLPEYSLHHRLARLCDRTLEATRLSCCEDLRECQRQPAVWDPGPERSPSKSGRRWRLWPTSRRSIMRSKRWLARRCTRARRGRWMRADRQNDSASLYLALFFHMWVKKIEGQHRDANSNIS